MLALIAKVRVKPDQVGRFLEALQRDVEGTLKEPGCVRFDVLRDETDSTVFYMYEVYRDRAAFEVHQQTPHFKAFFAEAGDALTAPPEGWFATNVLPQSDTYWSKRGV